jgi:hypothetical protein
VNENEDRQGQAGGQGETAGSRKSPSEYTRNRPFLPDPSEKFCEKCCRLVIRRRHRSRCPARRGGGS